MAENINNYTIKVDYKEGRDNLANSLLALSKIIDGHKQFSDILLLAAGEEAQSSTSIEMENIKKGSIEISLKKLFKRNNGEIIQDNAIKNFIDSATETFIDFTKNNNTITKNNIPEIRKKLVENYTKAGGKNQIPIEVLPDDKIINCAKALEIPKENLTEKQGVEITIQGQKYASNKNFKVDETEIKKEYSEEEKTKDQNISIEVKKAAYIGDSKWLVLYQEKSVDAKISDTDWLAKFQNGELADDMMPAPKDVMFVKADIIIEKKSGKEEKVELDIKQVIRLNKYRKLQQNLFK